LILFTFTARLDAQMLFPAIRSPSLRRRMPRVSSTSGRCKKYLLTYILIQNCNARSKPRHKFSSCTSASALNQSAAISIHRPSV